MSEAAYLAFDGVDLYFPAVLNESSEHTSTPTEHVVEQGANVSDHVRANATKISLQVLLTNHPIDIGGLKDMQITFVELDVPKASKPLIPTPGALIQAGASALNSLLNGEPIYKVAVLKAQAKIDLVKEVITLLEEWRDRAVLGKVVLPWGTFDSVVITRVAPSRSPETGDAAEVGLDFQQIRLVESKLVTAPVPTEVRGAVAKAKGRQSTSFVRDPGPKKSVLKGLTGG